MPLKRRPHLQRFPWVLRQEESRSFRNGLPERTRGSTVNGFCATDAGIGFWAAGFRHRWAPDTRPGSWFARWMGRLFMHPASGRTQRAGLCRRPLRWRTRKPTGRPYSTPKEKPCPPDGTSRRFPSPQARVTPRLDDPRPRHARGTRSARDGILWLSADPFVWIGGTRCCRRLAGSDSQARLADWAKTRQGPCGARPCG